MTKILANLVVSLVLVVVAVGIWLFRGTVPYSPWFGLAFLILVGLGTLLILVVLTPQTEEEEKEVTQ